MNTFADLELSRRLERLEGESATRFAQARLLQNPNCGSCFLELDGVHAVFDSPSSPVTQTFGLGLWIPPTDIALNMLEAFFLSRNAPVMHEVSPLAGIATQALLAKRGYRPLELTNVLYRPCSEPIQGVLNPRLKVRVVAEEQHPLWVDINTRGWAADAPELVDFLRDFGNVRPKRTVAFLAELDGIPIAAGGLSLGTSEAHFAGASTIPEGRRKGAQLALLDARLRYAATQGCELAMMCAAPGSSSQRNAERHGFRIAYTRIKWIRELPKH